MLFRIVQFFLYLPLRILFPTRVIGRKNLPKGKAIYIANHRSNLDVALLAIFIFKKQYFIAKKELFKNKFVGAFYKKMGAISIDREKLGIDTVKKSLKVLKEEKILTIFPEGTRNRTCEPLLPFKDGFTMFAIKGRCDIIPIWFKKKPRLFRFNKIIIGERISMEEFYGEKLTEEITQRASDKVKDSLLKLAGLN